MTDLPKMSRPALRALAHVGVNSLEELTKLTEREFLALHGVGPASLPVIRAALAAAGLSFKAE
jgi:sulfite reductase beta subunit-like hemoprotein